MTLKPLASGLFVFSGWQKSLDFFICYKDLSILIKDANALCVCWKKNTDFISEYNERKYNIMQIQAERNTMQQHSNRKTKNRHLVRVELEI